MNLVTWKCYGNYSCILAKSRYNPREIQILSGFRWHWFLFGVFFLTSYQLVMDKEWLLMISGQHFFIAWTAGVLEKVQLNRTFQLYFLEINFWKVIWHVATENMKKKKKPSIKRQLSQACSGICSCLIRVSLHWWAFVKALSWVKYRLEMLPFLGQKYYCKILVKEHFAMYWSALF